MSPVPPSTTVARPARGRTDLVVASARVAVLLGVLFRLANLDGKVYWLDETYTSLALAGRSNASAFAELAA